MNRLVAVFGSSQTPPASEEWESGAAIGRAIGEAGYGVITGGYGGSMESVSSGAAAVGARVVGVTAPSLFPGRSGANTHVTELVEAPSLAARIGVLVERSVGCIALPGSIGTAAELFIAWNLNHIARRNGGEPYPISAVGPTWRRVGSIIAEETGALLEDVHWSDTPQHSLDWLLARINIGSGPAAEGDQAPYPYLP